MSSQESAEAKALTDATTALAAEVADLSALEPEVAVDLAVAHEQLAHVNPVSVEQVNAVAALAHTLGGLTAKLKTAAGGTPAAPAEHTAPSSAEPVPSSHEPPAPEPPPVTTTGGVAEPPAAAPASTEAGSPAADGGAAPAA